MPSQIEWPWLMITTAATEPASASSEPIERSISAEIITTVSPAAMTPMFADCRKMFQMFGGGEEVLRLEAEVEPDQPEGDQRPERAERARGAREARPERALGGERVAGRRRRGLRRLGHRCVARGGSGAGATPAPLSPERLPTSSSPTWRS